MYFLKFTPCNTSKVAHAPAIEPGEISLFLLYSHPLLIFPSVKRATLILNQISMFSLINATDFYKIKLYRLIL